MSDAFVIQVDGNTVGIVVREQRGFRFFASEHRFDRLEATRFRSPRAAQQAAAALLEAKRSRAA